MWGDSAMTMTKKTTNCKRQNFGFTLIEVLVSMAILSVTSLSVMSLTQLSNKNSYRIRALRLVLSAQNQIEAALKNPAAWIQTLNRNTNLSCVGAPPGCNLSGSADGYYDFILYGSEPNEKLTYVPDDTTSRYSIYGGKCSAGTPSPSSNCPIKYLAKWKPQCATYPCLNPSMDIKIMLVTEFGENSISLNPDNYGISTVKGILENSALSACQVMNGVYNSTTHVCRPKYAGRSCAAMGKPYEVVTGTHEDGSLDCSPVYRNQCNPITQVVSGFDAGGNVVCSAKVCPPNVDCAGNWTVCSAGWQSFMVTTPRSGSGLACPASPRICVANTNCAGVWDACDQSTGSQNFMVTIPPSGSGTACPVSPRSCAVSCVGGWSACVAGSRTYSIAVTAKNGGAVCPYANGTVDSAGCVGGPTACVGGWGACTQPCGGGLMTYTVTLPESGGGPACPFANGDVQACNTHACGGPTDCAGNWSSCNLTTGTTDFIVTLPASGGGAACPLSPKSCDVDCQGAWGACSGGTRIYTITQPKINGGVACPYANNATDTTACSVTCPGGSINVDSPDGNNHCTFTWASANYPDSALVSATNGGHATLVCQLNGTWSYNGACPNPVGITCPGGGTTVNSVPNGLGQVNTCAFGWGEANVGDAVNMHTQTNGGTSGGSCSAPDGWNFWFNCPAIGVASCPGGAASVPSSTVPSRTCFIAWPITAANSSYSGGGTNGGFVSANCDSSGNWSINSVTCP